MELSPLSRQHQRKKIATSLPFWAVVALLTITTLLHYLTPQTRLLLSPLGVFLSRHAIERVIFVLPMAIATFAFRQRGGLITLALAVLIMLPRAIWISPRPADAFVEIATAAVVGFFVIWMIEAQAREKALHQEAISRLSAINAVSTIVTRSLELKQILNAALGKVLEATDAEAGMIFRLDRQSQELALAAHLFSPFFLVALILFTIIGFLPYHSYDKMVQWIFRMEKNTGISAFLLLGILFYWMARLLHVL